MELSRLLPFRAHRVSLKNDAQPSNARACRAGDVDRFEGSARTSQTRWWLGRPLSEGKNAHHTNTREQFAEALKSDNNWFEGDVRKEINSDKLEMRHDKGHESGDNLTLKEWLQMGKASGRGLKLDVKEGQHLERILDEVEQANIPSERLMFNLGDADMAKFGPEIRKRFPNAILAVNPPSGPLDDKAVDRMIENAERGGKPVAFVVRHDQLTDAAIARLKPHGAISVWTDQGHAPSEGDRQRVIDDLKRRGVNGVIDIPAAMSTGEKIGVGLDKAKNWVKDRWDSVF